jgi:hypothetical protein
MGKRLMFLISSEGKTSKQLAKDTMKAKEKYNKAEKKSQKKDSKYLCKKDLDYFDFEFKFDDMLELKENNGLKNIKAVYLFIGLAVGMLLVLFFGAYCLIILGIVFVYIDWKWKKN